VFGGFASFIDSKEILTNMPVCRNHMAFLFLIFMLKIKQIAFDIIQGSFKKQNIKL
jgi:hypothetical protein